MTPLIGVMQVAGASGAALVAGWWSVLALVALPAVVPRRTSDARLSFAVVVPAHNEENFVGTTVTSLAATAYSPKPEVLVVADNCTDLTANNARIAGASVLERQDRDNLGKSFALDFALKALRAREVHPDIVAVVDADTTVSPEFFEFLADAISRGADVVQAHYAAAPSESPLGQLRRLAFSLVHWSRPLGAARLRLPTTLKGNGMAFRWEVVRDGMPGSGIAEDAAATLDLAERGIVVRFEPGAVVTGLMAERFSEARTQDLRWEGGRQQLFRRAVRLAWAKSRRGEFSAAAASIEIASPPLTIVLLAAMVAAAFGAAGIGSRRLGLLSLGLTATSVIAGLSAARAGRPDLKSLVHVPEFVFHKVRVYLTLALGRGPRGWVRTDRPGQA